MTQRLCHLCTVPLKSVHVRVYGTDMKLYSTVFAVVLLGCIACDGAKIMGIFPIPAPSHNILGMRLMKELAKRGHEVTMVSPFQQKETKNYKAILLPELMEAQKELTQNILKTAKGSFLQNFPHFSKMLTMYSECTLNNTDFQKLLKSDAKFDLIIMEAMFNEAHVGLGHHYNAPIIVLSTVGSSVMVNKYAGNPAPASMVPDLFLGFPAKMSFHQRLLNTLATWTMELFQELYHLRVQNDLLHKYFPQAPHVKQLMKDNVALLLLNSDPSFDVAKPLVPNMVHIGGYHVEEPKELPQDLKSYLDNAKTGFVLFSLGSNMKSTMIPLETRQAILKVFAEMPFKILWKFEDEELPGKPDNVKISKWLPQNDILAHPNIRLFISHGGLLSTTEAVHHGVPVVGIPIFGDQKANMVRAEALGIAKTVPFDDVTEETLSAAIKEVLNNKIYRMNARERSRLMRDQPQRPIDTAMFWIEYVLRNPDTSHLKTPALHLEWYQLYMLDVYATLIGGVLLVSTVFYLLVKKLCCSKKAKKVEKEKKKKH